MRASPPLLFTFLSQSLLKRPPVSLIRCPTNTSFIHTFFHVPFFDAWALPSLALVDCVSRYCTKWFHAFSPDYYYGSIAHTTGRLTYTYHCTWQSFSQGHGSGNLSIDDRHSISVLRRSRVYCVTRCGQRALPCGERGKKTRRTKEEVGRQH